MADFHEVSMTVDQVWKELGILLLTNMREGKPIQTLRKILHAVVVILNPLAAGWFARGIFRMCQEVPGFAKSDFLIYGRTNMPFLFSLWVHALQITYFGMYSVIDLLDMFSKRGKLLFLAIDWLHTAASFVLFAIVFPVTMTTGILFWGMYIWDRNNIHPPILDDWLPVWGNHFFFTLPVLLSFTYMLTSNKEEPPKRATVALLLIFLSIYAYIFFAVKVSSGKWVYLCLEHLSPMQVHITLTFAVIAPIFFHHLGYKINGLITRIKVKK